MLLLRSEEHVERWLEQRSLPRGASFSVEQCWGLATAWYADKLSPAWRRHTPDEAQAVFTSLGLTGSFWQLAPPAAVSGGAPPPR